MDFAVLTIFPELFAPFWEHGMVRRAIAGGKVQAFATDIREFTENRHRTVDDRPYGGGPGMVMKPEPLAKAIRWARQRLPAARTVLLSPQGIPFSQSLAREFADESGFILVCGRYEGVDERIVSGLVDAEVSVGDYVLTGGELPAMIVMDAVIRLIPGVLGGADSAGQDSFSQDLLEHAHYTRPPAFEGEAVPEVLLSGNHAAIDRWRQEQALIRTVLRRPDLLENRRLSASESAILKVWCTKIASLVRGQPLSGADPLSGDE